MKEIDKINILDRKYNKLQDRLELVIYNLKDFFSLSISETSGQEKFNHKFEDCPFRYKHIYKNVLEGYEETLNEFILICKGLLYKEEDK